jgi:lipoprotein-releasing system permease protein
LPIPAADKLPVTRRDHEDEDEDAWDDDEDGWEDPGVEIARLRASGALPPAAAAGGEVEEPPEPTPPRSSDDVAHYTLAASTRPAVLDPVLVGRELAAELGVRVGMRVQVITPVARMTPAGEVPGLIAARIAGVFYARQYEYDSGYVYASLGTVQALLRAHGRITHIEVRLRDPDALDEGADALRAILDDLGRDDLEIRDWRATHKNLFSAMFIEKAAMSVALLFVILVAAFGILATSLMAVLERAPEIAILKTMGITDRRIARVFVAESVLLGLMGSVGGILTGLAICAIGRRVGLPVDESIYYIQRLPLEVDPFEVFMVGLCAITIVWLSSVYPARAAARVRPVDALRSLD